MESAVWRKIGAIILILILLVIGTSVTTYQIFVEMF